MQYMSTSLPGTNVARKQKNSVRIANKLVEVKLRQEERQQWSVRIRMGVPVAAVKGLES